MIVLTDSNYNTHSTLFLANFSILF